MQLPEIEEIPETTNVSIIVQDENEDPVSGATVAISGTEISSTTGSQGGCTLQNVPCGSQTITVTATGYENYTNTINVSSENDEFTITLIEE